MRLFRWLAIGLLLALIVLGLIFSFLLGAKDSENSTKQDVEIKAGMGRSDIAVLLAERQLIRSQFAFYLYENVTNAVVIPGIYELSADQSASVILGKLNSGEFKVVRVTIKEGWWAKDIEAELVQEKKMTQMVGFAAKAAEYEGYLFPDTYDFKVEATIDDVIKRLRDNFATRTEGLKADPDVVILASIIEREAKGPSDRTAIAGVYTNRLKKGMRLEADATIQYAKGSSKSIVTTDDYRNLVSPYNTYLNDGFPPGPISNPGLDSIKAALNPDSHDYYYYFHAKGETYFSKTFAEHSAKVRQYFQ